MMKKELIYMVILDKYIQTKITKYTQIELSRTLKISIGQINKTIKELENIGAIEIKPKSFELIDYKKLLLFWATKRNMTKDIIYKTHSNMTIKEIESTMPNKTIFTAYSGYRQLFNDAPSDYDKVCVYSDDFKNIKQRFPFKIGNTNIFVLKQPYKFSKIPICLLYVDLWNLKDWFASEYLKALEKRIFHD